MARSEDREHRPDRSVEACPCPTCVWQTVAAKMAYLYVKSEFQGRGPRPPTEAELEARAVELLRQAVVVEQTRRHE